MFGSTILDVAIGLVFVYLLLSLLVTAGTELLASWMNWRADTLRKGLERILDSALAEKLCDHPLIRKLSKGDRGPSYIPPGTFALALVDVMGDLSVGAPQPARDLRSLIGSIPNPDVRRVLSLLAEDAGQDGQKLKRNIEDWFNNSMDRVAGWYKRKAQAVNVALAMVLTLAANADSLLIVRGLSNDAALRSALVAQAQELAKERPAQPATDQQGSGAKPAMAELEERVKRLSALGIPVGWTDEPSDGSRQWPGWTPRSRDVGAWAGMWGATVRFHLLGWLLTALAASLGAPFWFDMLDKIITIRSAGEIPEQKPNPPAEPPRP